MRDKQNCYKEIKRCALIVFGSFLFALGMNYFIVPLKLYSSGVLGIAQIIRTLLYTVLGDRMPSGIDIAGMLNFVINIPLFFVAYRTISKSFLARTICSVISQTIFLTLIHIPAEAVMADVLSNCMIGGIISGIGIGLALRASGSGGGLDILGFYFTTKFTSLSVGKISLMINIVIFAFCAVLFDVQTALYSIIYTACFTLVLDRMHHQNINTMCLIFSKNESIQGKIMNQMRRGVTFWNGAGAYTKKDTYILLTVISKYEVSQLKNILKETDPQAFVLFLDGLSVSGNYEKRL